MSECEGFSLVSPEKTPPNTSLGNSCLADGTLATEQEKGALYKISRNPCLEIPLHLGAQWPWVGVSLT